MFRGAKHSHVTGEEGRDLFIIHSSGDGPFGNFEPIGVEYGQHGSALGSISNP